MPRLRAFSIGFSGLVFGIPTLWAILISGMADASSYASAHTVPWAPGVPFLLGLLEPVHALPADTIFVGTIALLSAASLISAGLLSWLIEQVANYLAWTLFALSSAAYVVLAYIVAATMITIFPEPAIIVSVAAYGLAATAIWMMTSFNYLFTRLFLDGAFERDRRSLQLEAA